MKQLFAPQLPELALFLGIFTPSRDKQKTFNETSVKNEVNKKCFLRHQEENWENCQPASLLQKWFDCHSPQAFKNKKKKKSTQLSRTHLHTPALIFFYPILVNFVLCLINGSQSFFQSLQYRLQRWVLTISVLLSNNSNNRFLTPRLFFWLEWFPKGDVQSLITGQAGSTSCFRGWWLAYLNHTVSWIIPFHSKTQGTELCKRIQGIPR